MSTEKARPERPQMMSQVMEYQRAFFQPEMTSCL